jgi:hypothetical protein
VSEEAAAAARAAGGNRPCEPPFPASCRYAGTGREHTAALIAATVLAEHPGSTALIARGDDFADAITGGAFAAAGNVPILLTPSDQLNTHTEQFLRDNSVGSAVVLGGTAAVSDPVFAALPVATRSRVAGAERTATAARIATELWRGSGRGNGGALVVNVRDPQGWQTALAAAVASAVYDAPQIGVEPPPAELSTPALEYLRQNPGPVMAMGRRELVSDDQLRAADAAS